MKNLSEISVKLLLSLYAPTKNICLNDLLKNQGLLMFRVNSVIFHVHRVHSWKWAPQFTRRTPQQGTKIHELLQFHEKKKSSSCLAFTIVCKFKSYKVLLFVCCIKLAAASLRKEVFVPSLLHFLEFEPNKFEKRSILSPDIKFQFFIQPRKRPKSVKIWPFTITFVEKSTLN